MRLDDSQDELEDPLVDFQRQTLPNPREAAMVGRLLIERNIEKPAEREAIPAAPGDAALRVDAFQVPNEQHAEIIARRDRAPAAGFVMGSAEFLDERVEASLGEQPIELVVKHMPRPPRERADLGPELLLSLSTPPAERHRILP